MSVNTVDFKNQADISSYWMTLRNERIPEIERGNTRSPSMENSLWKRLMTCRKKD